MKIISDGGSVLDPGQIDTLGSNPDAYYLLTDDQVVVYQEGE